MSSFLQSRVSRSRAGFTLLEIMIVVLIIALLLAIAIPSYLSAREKSGTKVCQSHLRHIQQAKEQWAIEKSMSAAATPDMTDLVTDYLRDRPYCPTGGDYHVEPVSDDPWCSIGDPHVFE